MDEIRFDSLVRAVATAATRRQTLIAVLAGIVPAVMQCVSTEARNAKRHKDKNQADRERSRRHSGRNRHGQQDRNHVHGERKRKKKCKGGLVKCGKACKDLQSDVLNCGGCGQMCQTGQICQGGICACAGPNCASAGCNATNCTGCCEGTICQPGGTSQRCGRNGEPCATCGSGQTCNGLGTCTSVSVACDATTCSGCCAGATCQSGDSDEQCGANGAACITCANDEQCDAGSCRSLSMCPNPGTCGDRPECGPGTISCTCGTTVEGDGFCTRGGSCSTAEPCTSSSDCPVDHSCSRGCCDEPVCIQACELTCVAEPVVTTCASVECGSPRNNCGLKVDCGACGGGKICQDFACVPEPDPVIECPGCGDCSLVQMEIDNIGFCGQSCRAASMCAVAKVDTDIDLLHRELRRRGFAVVGPAYALEVDELSDAPDASILIIPFENNATNETAGLAYGMLATGGNPVPIVVIGDDNESPTLALIVDNGQIQEIEPAANRQNVRGLQRRQNVASGEPPPFTCRRCSASCRFSAGLGGIAIGIIFAVIAVGTGGVGAIALGLAGAAFGLGGYLAGEYCPGWCGCVYCGCTDTCYNTAGECTAVCQASLSCLSRICDSARPGDC